MKWILKKCTWNYKKKIILFLLQDILEGKGTSIDNKTAEDIITMAIKSNGNKVTSFIIKD